MGLFILGVLACLVTLLIQSRVVGPTFGGDGSTPSTGRQTKTGESAVSQVHGKYYEASSRGVLFAGQLLAGTGQAPSGTISTVATYVLYNPVGSGKRLSIVRRGVCYVSGTLGTGVLYDCVCATVPQTVPSGGTAIIPVCLTVGNVSAVAAVGLPRVTATVTAPTPIGVVCYLGPQTAATLTTIQANNEDLEGAIVIEPGCSYQMQSISAGGSTPLINPFVWWEEVPIVNSQG